MDCDDIRALLARGETPAGPEWEAHRRECDLCAELFAGDVALGRGLAATAQTPAADVDALYSKVSTAVERERGPLAWLRSRRTAVRVGLGVAAVALIGLLVALFMLRVDIGDYPIGRMVLVLGLFSVTTAAAIHESLRPLHRPALPRGATRALLVAAVFLPLAIAALPQAYDLHPASLAGVGEEFVPRAVACFVFGMELAIPVILLLRLFDRRPRSAWYGALLAAAVGGLTANIGLQVHCPITNPAHLIFGHATVPLALVGLYALALQVSKLRVRRRQEV